MLFPVWLGLLLILRHSAPNSAASVRLVNGTDPCSGRVEVFIDGRWSPVFHDDWDMNDGVVVCREVGCGPPVATVKDAFFGQGQSQILIGKFKCVNTESSLINCEATRGNAFDVNKQAGVICGANTRLVNGINTCSGRVEVLHEGTWGTVCDSGWDLADAVVVCRELGCGDAVEVKRGDYFGWSSGPILMDDVNCVGNESMLKTCDSEGSVNKDICDGSKNAGVICQSPIRLVNGKHACSGRVEVYRGGRWGTVCENGWDMKEAAVVCKELGCGVAITALKGAINGFGEGTGPVWLRDVECDDTDTTLRNCKSKIWGVIDCGHDKDSGVVCEYPVKLTGSMCSGKLEVFHAGQWGGVCADGWDRSDAEVVCSEMSCGNVLQISSVSPTQTAWMSQLKCIGSESVLMSCASRGWTQHSCSSGQHVSITCRLLKVVNGPSKCSGTLQIFHQGLWGAVCDYNWDQTDAMVACRELGCSGHVEATGSGYFGLVGQQMTAGTAACVGTENRLTNCISNWPDFCGPDHHAGVICEVSSKFTVRITVLADPAVDPNDPDVREIVLEKIKEKLPDDEDFKLSWKTQTSGKIFQAKNTFYPNK